MTHPIPDYESPSGAPYSGPGYPQSYVAPPSPGEAPVYMPAYGGGDGGGGKKRSWFARHKVWTVLGALALAGGIGTAVGGSGGNDPAPPAPATASPAPSFVIPGADGVQESVPPAPDLGGTTAAPKKAPPKAAPELTAGQRQAIGSAEDYLSYAPFSRLGLIDQLTSQYGEKFSRADATYAVDHVKVDWNEQAVKSARSYLEMDHFSRAGLIEQLSSAYADRYTRAQATYAADKVGL